MSDDNTTEQPAEGRTSPAPTAEPGRTSPAPTATPADGGRAARLPQREVRRNFTLGVANGAFFNLVLAFISPTLVLALFVSKLGGSNLLVGLIPAITAGAYLLPQLFVAGRAQAMPRQMPWYAIGGTIRIACFVLITIATLLLTAPGDRVLLLTLFFILYSINSLASGFAAIPWISIVGKVIPPRRRGLFFGLRNFGGGVLALAASGVIGLLLDEQGVKFPLNFAIIFAVTTVLIILGVGSWVLIREPTQAAGPEPLSIMQMVRRGPGNLRSDRNYRYFLLARILLALAAVADPFFIVYATRQLGAPDSVAAFYIAALTIASILSNLFWSPLADFAGNRRMMILTAISITVVPASALLIPYFGSLGWLGWVTGVPGVSGLAASTNPAIIGFAIVFIFSGIALGAANIVNLNVLLNIAPAQRRNEYIGYLNTVLGIFTFFPVLGGTLIDLTSFEFVFAVAAAFGLLAMFASFGLSRGKVEE